MVSRILNEKMGKISLYDLKVRANALKFLIEERFAELKHS